MMIAAWQVQETIKVLLGTGELLRHRMLFMDAEPARWTSSSWDASIRATPDRPLDADESGRNDWMEA